MPANMFPQKEYLFDIPYAEKCVYDVLEKLPATYYVFHSVKWVKPSNKKKTTWKENDFLILNKSLGGIVLEVKGGGISYDVSQGIFVQTNTQTREENILDPNKRNDPLSQAVDGTYHYRKVLNGLRRNLDNRFPIEAAVWFSGSNIKNSIKSFPLNYREAKEAILEFNDLEKGPSVIKSIFDYYDNFAKTDITDDEFKMILDSIAQDFELIMAPGAKKGELDYAFLKLTNEQMGLLDYISEQNQATIQGVAGTGKTIIAKEAAKRFADEGRNVLFLCFNKMLYLDLQRRYPHKNITYINIHSFISKFNEGKDLSTKESRTFALLEIEYEKLNYDDIVIDEAQDFENEEILYFKNYMEKRDGHFFVFFDKNQVVLSSGVPEWIERSECKLVLTRNCRNTREIAQTAYNVVDTELNQKAPMISGDETTITISEKDPLQNIGCIIRTLKDKGYQNEEITILTLQTEDTSILRNQRSIFGIPITKEKNNSEILFTTAKKYKGLENKAVVIIDIDETAFLNEEKKKVFYVACSRASQKLCLFVNGDNEKIKRIGKAIDEESPFMAEALITMKTQSTQISFN